ncbi:MAG: hypothetical protein EAX91_13510 [Candidatus Lokiarchaeota archaeon]|nr:hypothetical protein [Candidatus Lokiarchaeota archaeon]
MLLSKESKRALLFFIIVLLKFGTLALFIVLINIPIPIELLLFAGVSYIVTAVLLVIYVFFPERK